MTVATALRWTAPASPHDINDRLTLAFVEGNEFPWAYGAAPIALARVATFWASVPDADLFLFDVYATVGALTAVLTGAWVLLQGGSRLSAFVATIVMVAWPAHIRLSHTDAPQIPQSALLMFTLLVLALPRKLRTSEALAAGLAFGLAVNLRPEGVLLIPVGMAWAWHSRRAAGESKADLIPGLAAFLALVGPHAAGMWLGNRSNGIDKAGLTCGSHGATEYGVFHYVPFHPDFGSWTIVILVVLGLVGSRTSVSTRVLTVGTALWVGALVPCASWSIGAGAPWALVRHQLLTMPFFATLAGWGANALVSAASTRTSTSTRAASWATVLAISLDLGSRMPTAMLPRTLDAEFSFAREAIKRIPDGCTIVAFFSDEDDAFSAPKHLSVQLGRQHQWRSLDDATALDAAPKCRVYYRSSACVSESPSALRRREENDVPFADRCAAFESQVKLDPWDERRIPARPWLREAYHTDPIRVGVYGLTERRGQ